MRGPGAVILLIALSLPLAFLARPSSGQAPAAPTAEEPAGVFGETIDVRAVNLELVVVDRDGHRVSGLGPADLRLTVDGQPMAIDYFSEIVEGRAVTVAPDTPGALPAARGVEPGGAVGTSYLVFVDDSLATVTHDRNVVLRGLIDELPRLKPQDRMAIVAFAGSKPEMLSTWSQSPADLRRALEQAVRRPGRGTRARAGVTHFQAIQELGEVAVAPPGLGAQQAPPPLDLAESAPDTACLVVRDYERNLQKVASAVTVTLRTLAPAPGRKVALLISGGWPRSAKEFALGTRFRNWPSGCRLVGPALWDPIHQVANQVGFTLYPVLAPDEARSVLVEAQDYPQPVNPMGEGSQLQETLALLARETGGESYAGGARRHLLANVAEDTRSYYWLGFTPTWKGDDRHHDVKVEVARPGLKVRSRLGFQDLSRRSEVSQQVERSLLFADAPATGAAPLHVELGPLPKPKRGERAVRVQLKVTIPLDQVTMVQQGEKYVGELELRVAILDQEGNRNDVPVIPIHLAGPLPQAGQTGIYEAQLLVRPLRQEVVVALFDPATGKVLEGRTSIGK